MFVCARARVFVYLLLRLMHFWSRKTHYKLSLTDRLMVPLQTFSRIFKLKRTDATTESGDDGGGSVWAKWHSQLNVFETIFFLRTMRADDLSRTAKTPFYRSSVWDARARSVSNIKFIIFVRILLKRIFGDICIAQNRTVKVKIPPLRNRCIL